MRTGADSFETGRRRAGQRGPGDCFFPDTNVLITRFFASDGVAEIQDFMPVTDDSGRGGPAPADPAGDTAFGEQLTVHGGGVSSPLRLRKAEPHSPDNCRATTHCIRVSENLSLALTATTATGVYGRPGRVKLSTSSSSK